MLNLWFFSLYFLVWFYPWRSDRPFKVVLVKLVLNSPINDASREKLIHQQLGLMYFLEITIFLYVFIILANPYEKLLWPWEFFWLNQQSRSLEIAHRHLYNDSSNDADFFVWGASFLFSWPDVLITQNFCDRNKLCCILTINLFTKCIFTINHPIINSHPKIHCTCTSVCTVHYY